MSNVRAKHVQLAGEVEPSVALEILQSKMILNIIELAVTNDSPKRCYMWSSMTERDENLSLT